MAISPFGWHDYFAGGTKLDAENLEAMHSAAGAYTDAQIAAASRVFDVRDFAIPAGTADTTDRSATWASMITTVNGFGGGLIEVPVGQYCITDVYLLDNVWLRFLPDAVFIYPQTGLGGDAAIFRLHTVNRNSTSYLRNVRLYGRFVVDGTTFPGDRYNNASSPRAIMLGNVQDFYIEDAHAINLPGPAGNTIQGNAQGGGARIVPNRGRIDRVTHESSGWMGNSAIQLGGSRDLEVGYAWIDFGTAFRVEAHFSGTGNSVNGYCESVTCRMAACDDPGGGWRAATAAASTGVFTSTAHGLVADTPVQVREKVGGGGGGTVLPADTTFYVVNPTTNTFQLSSTVGGSAFTWTLDVTASFVGPVSRAVLVVAHNATLVRRVKVLQARARGGADGVYVSHDTGAIVEDSEVGGIDVEGGGKAVVSSDGSQFDMSGFVFGPGTVRSAAGAGCHLLPFATYRDMRAKSCSGVGFRDLTLPDGTNARARIIGGGAEKNGSYGYQQNSYATLDLNDVVTKDPPPSFGSNVLSADEAGYETGTGSTYTAVGTASRAQDATVFHSGTKSLKVTVGSGGAGQVRTAQAPSAHTVTAGQSIYCEGYCYAVAAARQARFNVRFTDSSNAIIGVDQSTLNTQLVVGAWVKISGYVTALAGATQMMLLPTIATASAGEVFNWDDMVLAIATGPAPTQAFGITVAAGLTANLIAGDHSKNGTAASTGAGTVKTAALA